MGMSFDFPKSLGPSLLEKVPNQYFRVPPFYEELRWPRPAMRGYVFVAVENIEKGEEILVDYRFNPRAALPDWYVPVNKEETDRRWGKPADE